MATFISHSPAQTERLGYDWGNTAVAGTVIALSGDLGAGKTQLVRGIALGLGSPVRVHSPTFALINEYSGGRLPLYHIDLYRLDAPEQIVAAGLEEFFRPMGAVTVVEWAEKWFDRLASPEPRNVGIKLLRRARIDIIGESHRRIEYEDLGG